MRPQASRRAPRPQALCGCWVVRGTPRTSAGACETTSKGLRPGGVPSDVEGMQPGRAGDVHLALCHDGRVEAGHCAQRGACPKLPAGGAIERMQLVGRRIGAGAPHLRAKEPLQFAFA